jgi:hypothetical protein
MSPVVKFICTIIAALFVSPLSYADGGNDKLIIDFTDAYSNEAVNCYVDKNKILSEKLTTDWTSGVAKYLAVESPVQNPSLTVEVPRLALKKVFQIKIANGRFIAISLRKGVLAFDQTKKPVLRD